MDDYVGQRLLARLLLAEGLQCADLELSRLWSISAERILAESRSEPGSCRHRASASVLGQQITGPRKDRGIRSLHRWHMRFPFGLEIPKDHKTFHRRPYDGLPR